MESQKAHWLQITYAMNYANDILWFAESKLPKIWVWHIVIISGNRESITLINSFVHYGTSVNLGSSSAPLGERHGLWTWDIGNVSQDLKELHISYDFGSTIWSSSNPLLIFCP